MIHKHEWLRTLLRDSPKAEFANQYFEALVEQIQLDAIQEGMRRAAEMHELGDSVHSMEQTILIAANNLTLKDL